LGTGPLNLFSGSLSASADVTLPNPFSASNPFKELEGFTFGGSGNLTLTGAGTLRGNVTFQATGYVTLTGGLSGSGSVPVNAGVVTFTGAGSYSGGTFLNGGITTAAHPQALGTGTVHFDSGGVLSLPVNATLANPVQVGPGGGDLRGYGTLS